ncbi:VTT domain-containing protein [Anaerolineales bacterium HSG6]|nr:VTT domain-containing protein [Anaerolineales bacterium HSG6]
MADRQKEDSLSYANGLTPMIEKMDNQQSENQPLSRWWPWLVGGVLLIGLLVGWLILTGLDNQAVWVERFGLTGLVRFIEDVVNGDTLALRTWMEQLGILGPVVYFLLNVAQIVVAPIPGYPVQVLGGVLFGVALGSICAVGGMVAGGTLAAWLGRKLGRGWLNKQVGAEELERWSETANIDSFWTWWAILLIPLGDVPYFFAGLSRIPLRKFALAILLSRGPFTVLIVWFGNRVAVDFPISSLAWVMTGVGLIVIIGFHQRERFERWGQAYLKWVSERTD